MIARLLELKLSCFRAFREEQTIPLDADIVLIHGVNGAAKTSLLAGLEFALTGEVRDLKAFSDDYPRCLVHLGADSPAKASVRFLAEGGDERKIGHETEGKGGTSRTASFLTAEERNFFVERCYLSQNSLGRLLENYQASDRDQPEQPLVRFVRELLGLELLDNLTIGLHDVGHVARMEKGIPAFRAAKENEANAREKLRVLSERRSLARSEWARVCSEFTPEMIEGIDVPHFPLDVDAVDRLIKVRSTSTGFERDAARVRALRGVEGRLARSMGFLGEERVLLAATGIRKDLEASEIASAKARERLESIFTRFVSLFKDREGGVPQSGNVVSNYRVAYRTANEWQGQFQSDLKKVQDGKVRLYQLRDILSGLMRSRVALRSSSSETINSQQRLAEILAALSEHLHGEECPVCSRNYSEVGKGSLRDKVIAEIAAIGSDLKVLEESERRRVSLNLQIAEVEREISAIEEELEKGIPLIERREEFHTQIEGFLADCANAEADVEALSALLVKVSKGRAELSAADLREKQRTTAREEINALALEIGLQPDNRSAKELASLISTQITSEILKIEGRLRTGQSVDSLLARARDAGIVISKIESEIESTQRSLDEAEGLVQSMLQLVQQARDVAKAATGAKSRLLDHVFNETLNKLWGDLFQRLAKQERFRPWLSDPVPYRGHIRTSIQGRADTEPPFSQFAAVASSGNVSTAALCLFLALHLVEQPRHQVLVLDDPVQNMDDVHVVQLASLVREIRRSANRQIIVAVHERALFDYLCLELSPTESNGSLLALELQRETRDGTPHLVSKRHTWSQDSLSFGLR